MGTTPIRFSVQAALGSDRRTWVDLAKETEDRGFHALYVADHPGSTASPFPALAAAAGATTTLRLGTYVLNAGIRDPLAIAADAATLDVVSDGRFVLGLGAGHTPAEWHMTGRDYPTAAARVDRLAETVDVVSRLLAGEVVTHHSDNLHLDDAVLEARGPAAGAIPLLVGGNGARVLRLGAQRADIVSITGTGRTLADGHRHEVDWTNASIAARVAIVRAAAPEPGRPVLDALVQYAALTDERETVAERVAQRVPGATAADVLASPFVLIGTLDELTEEVRCHRDRWGFTSFVVRADAIDAVAPLINHLTPTH